MKMQEVIKIKKFYVVAQVGRQANAIPLYSRRWNTLADAKKDASIKASKVNNMYDYVILEAVEYVEMPIPQVDFKKVE